MRVLFHTPDSISHLRTVSPTAEALGFATASYQTTTALELVAMPADRPLVHVTLGSRANMAPTRAPAFLRTVIAALADMPVAAIVVSGEGVSPNVLGPTPSHVRVASWLPQPLILETCDLSLTHGGFSSVRESLRCGVPMVVAPIMIDQHYNGSRCEALGLGRTVGAAAATPTEVQAAMTDVIGTTSYRAQARQFQRRMLALPSLDTPVTDLEALA